MAARKRGKTKAARTEWRTGPDGGEYKLVRWYKGRPKRRQASTLFGEAWHRPGSLKEYKAAARAGSTRRRKAGRKK